MKPLFNRIKTAIMIAFLGFIAMNCGNNNHNHAPVCPAGQFLFYNQASGFTCQFSNGAGGGYGGYGAYGTGGYGGQYGAYPYGGGYGGYGAYGAGVTTGCPTSYDGRNESMVNWNMMGWFCIKDDILRPGGGDSPGGPVAPQQGGEYCNSVGMQTTGYGYSGYNQYSGYGMNILMCAPGFQCVSQNGTQPGQTANGYTGYGTTGQSGYCTR